MSSESLNVTLSDVNYMETLSACGLSANSPQRYVKPLSLDYFYHQSVKTF